MTEQEIFALIGKFIALVFATVGVLIALAKLWGEKWLENKFAKDLELFKTRKLHEFDLLLNRKTKWHETEHEVLSTSWKKLKNAQNSLKRAISAFKSFPDFDRMPDEEFDAFLKGSDLSDSEKDYINKQKDNRNMAYDRILDSRALNEAHKAFLDFHTYFEDNSIFLRAHIKEKFEKADDHIWSAWVSKKMDHKGRSGKRDFLMEAYEKEDKEIKPLVKEIEDAIQKELFPEDQK